MEEELLTFQKFKDPEVAKEFEEKLSAAGIFYQTETEDKFFDPSFTTNSIKNNINIRIRPADFNTANKVLDDYYRSQVEQVAPDHYLFSFTDTELMEILHKPDEWGHLDYQLARSILEKKGKPVNAERLEIFKQQRKKELARPETSNHWIVLLGYFAFAISPFLKPMVSVAGFFLAIIIGWILYSGKKTLPDGESVYIYTDSGRKQGRILMVVGAVLLIVFFIYAITNPEGFKSFFPIKFF
jgi:hypothetical protein